MTHPHSLRVLCAVVVALMLGWAGQAAAADRIVIVREGDDARKRDALLAETYLRVASELRSSGFEVRERAMSRPREPRAEVESEPDASVATLLVRRDASGPADVWIGDHLTRKTVVRRIDAGGDPATLALLVLELMRATLVESFALEHAPSPPPPPSSEVARFVDSDLRAREAGAAPPRESEMAPRRLHLNAGVGVLFGDVGTALAPAALLAVSIARPFCIGLFVMGPAFGATVRGDQGVAHVRQELALAEIAWRPAFSSVLLPRAALGAGGYHLSADGTAREPYRDGHDDAWAFLTSASIGASVTLTRDARFVLDTRVLLGFPRPVIAFASTRVATALRPSVALAGALEIDL